MSVFNDFQRLWMQRFPKSSLSDAWEQDVRASLDRHKEKISELTKELEQETLYVEYLERLLSDVEKYKESGGDPTALFEAATTNVVNAAHETRDDALEDAKAQSKSTLNLREPSRNINESKDKNNRLSLNTDNNYTSNNNNINNHLHNASNNNNNNNINNNNNAKNNSNNNNNNNNKNNNNSSGSSNNKGNNNNRTDTSSNDVKENDFESREDKDKGTEKYIRSQKNGALNQCISELAATINAEQKKNVRTDGTTPSHFVTVIEVNEKKAEQEANDGIALAADGNNSQQTATFSSFERKSTKQEPSAPPMSPAITSTSMSASAYAAHLEAKKKMPPRPPPKNMRRIEPPIVPGSGAAAVLSSSPKRDAPFAGSNMPLPSSSGSFSSNESPGNSLERNIKPSDILRQKSAESLEPKTYSSYRKTTPEPNKFPNTPELLEEFGRKLAGKVEILEKTKRSEINNTASPTGSLGRTPSTTARSTTTAGRMLPGVSPTGSLNKATKLNPADSSSTSSLDKKSNNFVKTNNNADVIKVEGSKESLASQGISDIIKSYESVSSLSSESAKVAQAIDNEPYYDTVPLDGADGEYVYIKPGRTRSSSSRDDLSTPGSTMPIHAVAQLSSEVDPESPGRSSNYVNIDYFLHQSNETRSSSLDSDGEYDGPSSGVMRTMSQEDHVISHTPGILRKNLVSAILESGNARGSKIRSMLSKFIGSETTYVECLNKMLQYKKAIHSTQSTSKPVITEEEENNIFFKIDELYQVHTQFVSNLKAIAAQEGGDVLIGETFRQLADMIDLYTSFLDNYCQALETVKKCSAYNPQFKNSVSSIVLNLQSLTLEDLLHKPVARVQMYALTFSDLLRETPVNHPDHQHLRQAQEKMQTFLQQFNVGSQRLTSDKNLRRLVKNSCIVELVDGHRKLRHLFLFNDVIACTKYKPSGRDQSLEYELKWIIPLKDVIVGDVDASNELKESSPANILQLKTHACTVRDQLLTEDKDDKSRKVNGEKYRRKLVDLESQLVLALPDLVFRIYNMSNNKTITFFLSSDFERNQWIDSILTLKQNCNFPGASNVNALEVRALLLALPSLSKTEMGSYLMRKTNDESLLVGDLHMTIQGLTGLEQACDLYICIEVDFYGHYFRKATTKMVCRSANPIWNESFVLELEGSQNVRVLLYEAQERPKLRAKHVIKLSSSWLLETPTQRVLKLNDNLLLNTNFRYVPGEVSLRRVPTAKPGALFGAKMILVLKREKRDIPFIISACIREVERRGMSEVGIYRVSGSASDLAKLKKSFETNAYEAEQLLKEVDIHSVTGILKFYLRELPEALFSDALYPRFFDMYSAFSNNNEEARIDALLKVFEELPAPNKACINHILDHLIRVHHQEADNKMSLHNLAMVFGPTLLRPGQTQTKQKDLLASSTVDVMAQAGILYSFLLARLRMD